MLDLKRHEKSHMAEEDRPYQCSTCGKRFTLASVLKEHIRIHKGKHIVYLPASWSICQMLVKTLYFISFVIQINVQP